MLVSWFPLRRPPADADRPGIEAWLARGDPTAAAVPVGPWPPACAVADVGAADNSAPKLVGAHALRLCTFGPKGERLLGYTPGHSPRAAPWRSRPASQRLLARQPRQADCRG